MLVHTKAAFIGLFVVFPFASQFVFSIFYFNAADTFGYVSSPGNKRKK